MKSKISVIIATRNSERFIGECIESIMNQDYRNFELIVVDDFSVDSTKKKIKLMQKNYPVKLIELKQHSGISKARNNGIKIAQGELIAFTDDDIIATKSWLTELIKGFTDNKTVSVGGPNLVPKNASEKEKTVDEILGFISGIGSSYIKKSDKIIEVKHNPSCNSIYTKEILEKINGFNENLSSNEDAELDYKIRKAGFKIKFNPKAIVFHHRKDSAKKLFNQAFWFALGRMQAIKIHIGMADWFRIVPSISILTSSILLVFGFYSMNFELFFYFISALFFLLLLISITAMLKYKKICFDYFVFVVSWFFGYGFGMLKGVIK